jgi:hypothetical protein
MKFESWIGALLFCALAASCTSDPRLHDPTAVHAQCPVCKCEGDLACVDVVVDGHTPQIDLSGRTYYFCSEQCRCDFAKKPNAYTGAK